MDVPEDRERGIRINTKDFTFFTAVSLLLSYNFAAMYMFFGQEENTQKSTDLIHTTS